MQALWIWRFARLLTPLCLRFVMMVLDLIRSAYILAIWGCARCASALGAWVARCGSRALLGKEPACPPTSHSRRQLAKIGRASRWLSRLCNNLHESARLADSPCGLRLIP